MHSPSQPGWALPALLLLLAAWMPRPAAACSTFVLPCLPDKQAISVRTNDFPPIAFPTSLAAAPAGGEYQSQVAACPGCSPRRFAFKHNTAWMTLGQHALYDGLNAGGLSVAALWNDDALLGQKYDAARFGPEAAFASIDVLPYILANFDSVKEAVAFFDPAKIQIVGDFDDSRFDELLTKLVFMPDADGVYRLPLHFSIMDASGDRAVLEGKGDRGYVWHYPAPPVLTNEPSLDMQLETFQRWNKSYRSVGPEYEDPALQHLAGLQGSADRGPFAPGDFGSPSRFIRAMAAVEEACRLVAVSGWEPFGTSDPAAAALSVAESLSHTIVVPHGQPVFDNLPELDVIESTMVTMMRDHAGRTYYWRTASDPTWKSLVLDRIKRAAALELDTMEPQLAVWQSAEMSASFA